MANREACELYIEQEIKESLKAGKKPWTIGKELAAWVEKLFEVTIKPRTLAQRAYRQQDFTNVKEKSNSGINLITYPVEENSVTHPPSLRGGARQNSGRPPKPMFNETNDSIEWAKWSWNPVTGCKHNCQYCYARDIANRFYTEYKFEPHFYPERLTAPKNTTVPENRKNESGIKNVFVCSMADLFGDWVPKDWIEKILNAVKESPDWTFLFLTKNPKRYKEFEFSNNCWIGATADSQKRMDEIFSIFPTLHQTTKASILFTSCEPLKEQITLKKNSGIDWLIIGAQSRTAGAPEFQPEWTWVESLICQSRMLEIPLYWKPNLTTRPKSYPSH